MIGKASAEAHVSVRLPEDLKRVLYKAAKARFEQPSDLVRRAIVVELARLSYLDEETQKAMGVLAK